MRVLTPRKTSSVRTSRCGIIFTTFLCLTSFVSSSQCIATTTRNPTSVTNDNGVGTISFNNTTNVFTSNNQYADADALATLFTGNSHYLKVTGFGFTVPDYGIICGVVVTIERRDGGFLSVGTGVRDNEIRLVLGNTVSGNNLATSSNWGSSKATATYGSSTEMWGTTLTPAIVNAGNFGVAISAHYNSLLSLIPSAEIDNIRMTIYYNPILPTHFLSFTTSLKNDNVLINFKTADEEDGEVVTVQRSLNNQQRWLDITKYDMKSGNNGKRYSFTDRLTEKGNYSYRLRITNINGQYVYSETKHVAYDGSSVLSAYPNPASDFITIENLADPYNLFISDLSMKRIKLPVQPVGNNAARIDTRSLPGGFYFISSGSQHIKFLKR